MPTSPLTASGEYVMSLFQLAHQRYGQTVIMVTHDQDLARRCERILKIADGQLIGSYTKEPR